MQSFKLNLVQNEVRLTIRQLKQMIVGLDFNIIKNGIIFGFIRYKLGEYALLEFDNDYYLVPMKIKINVTRDIISYDNHFIDSFLNHEMKELEVELNEWKEVYEAMKTEAMKTHIYY